MVKGANELLNDYDKLLETMKLQYNIVNLDYDEKRLMEFGALSLEFSLWSDRIERSIHKLGGFDQLSEQERFRIEERLREIFDMGKLIELKLDEWYKQDTSTMLQVKNQQITLRAYGGVNNSDTLALYFDEKQ